MNTFDYLFTKTRENGKVAKALSEKLQTEVDKNSLIDEIGKIDVGAIIQGIVKSMGLSLVAVTSDESTIAQSKYQNRVITYSIDFTNATSIGNYAMSGCMSLITVNIPNAVSIGRGAMQNCPSLTSVNMPNISTIDAGTVLNCISLKSLNMPNVTSIGESAMANCILLKSVRLGASQVATLANTNALLITPIANGTGYIYVPDDLVDSYKTATNWSVYADQIRPMSECVEEE